MFKLSVIFLNYIPINVLNLGRKMKPNDYGYFNSALLKLGRARVHADELQKEIKDFLGKSPYRLVVITSSNQKILRVEQTIDVPNTIPLLLGDFVHNCRSSLDHLATDLVLANNGGISSLYFPTGVDKECFHKALTKGIKKAGSKVVDKLKEAEIYRGGKGASIRGLHELDIADKHKMLIPNVSMVTLTNFKTGGLTIGEFQTNIEKNGTNMIITNFNQKLEFDEAINFDIEISDSECFSRQSLSKVVEDIFDSTQVLVQSFREDIQFPRKRTVL